MITFRKANARGADSPANIEKQKAIIADKVASALMMIDRDFIVTYVNESTHELLKQNEAAFRATWPDFQADKIVGTCIDVFHKDPQHQRKLLADPKNLPYRTEISVGDIRISLHVNGCFDAKGALTGHMLEWRDVSNDALLDAVDKTQAVMEFRLDGTVITANKKFLKLLGYTLDEVRNQHHTMFVFPDFRGTPEYKAFWDGLCSGKGIAYPYNHMAKGGAEIWLQTNYTPVLDASGKPYKIIKFASDITAQKRRDSDLAWSDCGRRQGDGGGRIRSRRQGHNREREFPQHSLAIDRGGARPSIEAYSRRSVIRRVAPRVRRFWEKLCRGEHDAGQYKKIGKGGKEVWLQASYNPILDDDGKPFKIVVYRDRYHCSAARQRGAAAGGAADANRGQGG